MSETVDPRRRLAARAVLGLPIASLAALGTGCAALPGMTPAGDPLPVPSLRVGTTWRYRTTNRYNGSVLGETTATVVATAPDLRVRLEGAGIAAPLEERYASPWTVSREATFDAPITFETPMPLVLPGLRPGTTLASRGRYRGEQSNRLLRWYQTLSAGRLIPIEVPAGRFEAIRIERMVHYEHPDPFRYDPVRIDTIWYAPAVGRWVAREWTGNYMDGGPTPQLARAREDWIRWELTAWQAGA